jgi:hypothetical protein
VPPYKADGTFALKNVFGSNVIRLSGRDERIWIRAVLFNSHDITDSGLTGAAGERLQKPIGGMKADRRYEGPLARLTQIPLCDSPLRG